MSANNRGSRGRHLERYNELLQFDLPKEYELQWEDKDDGTKVCWIRGDAYKDDNGETAYRFSAVVQDLVVENTDEEKIPEGEKPLDTIHRLNPDLRYIKVSKDPEAELELVERSFSVFGRQLKIYLLRFCFPVSQDKVVIVWTNGFWNEDNLSENFDRYRRFIDVVNSVRFRGNAFPPLAFTTEELMERLKPKFEDVESEIVGARYTTATPSDYLYAHYGKLKREVERLSGPNATVVLNNGEEFQALDLLRYLEEDGQSGTGVYRKISDAMKADDYDLDQTALLIAQVFRVSESAFVSRHDDECDIRERLMDKKWKFSALRSFAWTLAELANKEKKSIDDYGYDDLVDLCRFIEGREWLNYEEGSWFNGLCGHPDIHVYYMPGAMIDSGEAEEIYNLQNYNPIASLDAFRADLSQLKNVMIKIHNELLKNRDRSAKLDVPIAAVLQAWCVMAVSAKTPFFSEDGPMMFFHSYPKDALNASPIPVGPKTAVKKKAATKAKKPASKRKTTAKPRTSAPKKKEAPAVEPASENQALEIDPSILAEMTPEQAEAYKRAMLLAKSIQGQLAEIKSMVGQQAGMDEVKSHELVTGTDGRDRIKFGEYPAGTPIEWLVLERNGLEMLLLSEYGLDARAYGFSSNEWQACELREWLNDEFYSRAFNDAERRMILDDTHDTYKRTMSGEEPTGSVTDKVFLLSAREATRYFPSARELVCKATPYAKQNGAEIEGGPDQCHWWLRSPAVDGLGLSSWAGCIRANGQGKGWGIYSREICVRPVIRIRLTTEAVAGTFTNSAKSAPATKPAPAKKSTPKKTTTTQKKSAQSKAEKPTQGEAEKPAKPTAAKKAGPDVELMTEDGYVLLGKGKRNIREKQFADRLDLERIEIAHGIKKICREAFKGCANLKNIRLPDTLKIIEEEAFVGCGLTELEIPNGVEDLGQHPLFKAFRGDAFRGMEKLQTLSLPDSIEKAGGFGILESEQFKCLTMSRAVAEKLSGDRYMVKHLEKIHVTDASDEERDIIIRAMEKDGTLRLKGAIVIEDSAFSERDDLVRVVIPEGVTEIGRGAFGSCKNLKEVILPQSLVVIGQYAFHSCESLQAIRLPENLIEIGLEAFRGCKKLRKIELPQNLRKLGTSAFDDCDSLHELVIPKSVEYMGKSIFGFSDERIDRFTILGAPRIDDPDDFEYWDVKELRITQAFYDQHKEEKWLKGRYNELVIIKPTEAPYISQVRQSAPATSAYVPRHAGSSGSAPTAPKVADPNADRKRQLEAQIRSLEAERDAVRGIFGGIKRKKLQSQIDELQTELRRLS